MDGQDLLNGFQFHHNGVCHKQVNPVTTVQMESLVVEWQRDLTRKRKSPPAQFIANAFLICRFKQPGAQVSMDLNRRRNNFMCRDVEIGLAFCFWVDQHFSALISASLRLCGEFTLSKFYSLGAGFHSNIFFKISSCFNRSLSAWKFNRMRCLNTGI